MHQQAERVLEDSGVPVRHVAGDRAFYNLNRDEIVLPERGQFPSANHYYQTALHELGHSTGHPERIVVSCLRLVGEWPMPEDHRMLVMTRVGCGEQV